MAVAAVRLGATPMHQRKYVMPRTRSSKPRTRSTPSVGAARMAGGASPSHGAEALDEEGRYDVLLRSGHTGRVVALSQPFQVPVFAVRQPLRSFVGLLV